MIYLDHNATTPIAPEVRAAMLPPNSKGYPTIKLVHQAKCG